ncbi:MAG: septum formation family protein [Actinobacteria bacterium]|nr:septum formation family protein [Actinomycetota bacterium]
MSKSILIRPLLVLLAVIIVFVLVLMLIFGAFGGGDDSAGSAAGGDSVQPEAPEPSGEPSEGNVKAADLEVGDCISDANSQVGDVRAFDAVDCDEPHDGEVYTLIRLEGGPDAKPPSEAFINGKGQRGCRARLRRQLTAKAFRDPQLGFKFVYPTPESWADGDRHITCVATFKKPRTTKLAQRSQEQ